MPYPSTLLRAIVLLDGVHQPLIGVEEGEVVVERSLPRLDLRAAALSGEAPLPQPPAGTPSWRLFALLAQVLLVLVQHEVVVHHVAGGDVVHHHHLVLHLPAHLVLEVAHLYSLLHVVEADPGHQELLVVLLLREGGSPLQSEF